MEHPFEPFKIKMIEPIARLSRHARIQALKDADYNLFKIPSEKVAVDLLTDSGTSALSHHQWSQLMLGDESYAQAKSWERLEKSIKKFTGMREVIPVHQGRAAEKIIAEMFSGKGDIVVSNSFFDTTRANFEHRGVSCVDIPSKKSSDIAKFSLFKGDIDLGKLQQIIKQNKKRLTMVVFTLTNNTGGGQPASFKNIERASQKTRKANIPLLIDASRIAENAYFIWRDELKQKGNISLLIRKLFSFSDIAFMSAKKDGLANMGGFIVTNNNMWASKIRELGILYEGYSTYGGLSGREMETLARGLEEVVEPSYLAYRIDQVAYLHARLLDIGIPLLSPSGGHAVYVDAKSFLNHIPKEQFPGHALAVALYQEGGVRSCEIGSLMFGENAAHELVRLAIPRRVYTQAHIDHVVNTFQHIIQNKKRIKGFAIMWEPKTLRHFTCTLKPV